MKGKLLEAKPEMFHALNYDPTTHWTLTIESRFLKRKVIIEKEIHDSVDVLSFIGKNIDTNS
jgi:hypothetical protein